MVRLGSGGGGLPSLGGGSGAAQAQLALADGGAGGRAAPGGAPHGHRLRPALAPGAAHPHLQPARHRPPPAGAYGADPLAAASATSCFQWRRCSGSSCAAAAASFPAAALSSWVTLTYRVVHGLFAQVRLIHSTAGPTPHGAFCLAGDHICMTEFMVLAISLSVSWARCRMYFCSSPLF